MLKFYRVIIIRITYLILSSRYYHTDDPPKMREKPVNRRLFLGQFQTLFSFAKTFVSEQLTKSIGQSRNTHDYSSRDGSSVGYKPPIERKRYNTTRRFYSRIINNETKLFV